MTSTLVLSDVGDETWGAVLEEDEVVELHVENARRPGIGGNLYKGRVSRVLPGMQAAFVDIGIEKDVFLHVSDLPAARPAEFAFEADDGEGDAAVSDGRVTPDTEAWTRPRDPGAPARAIEDLLREGQEILVQVSKEPIAAKGARVTAQIGLPGRVLVHLPFLDRVFVSRRIEEPNERARLAALTERAGRGSGGWIVRTAAEGVAEAVLGRDAAYLADLWATISDRERRSGPPRLLHQDLDLAERLLRDVLSEGFREVIVNSERLLATATGFIEKHLAGLKARVRSVSDCWAVFDNLGIHQEIERAREPRVWLPSGGCIVVNATEALVAIDVNTGKYVGKRSLEQTALKTNLEAVCEIVRLLRLRDLGGIVVIDFIDMTEEKSRKVLSEALKEELRKDRSRTKLLAMSDFGLVQLTRKRTRRSLERALQIACPACAGRGRIRSAIALYYEVQRDLARGAPLRGPAGPVVRLHPAAIARLEEERLRLSVGNVEWFEAPAGGPRSEGAPANTPRLAPDPSLPEDRYRIEW